MSYRADKQVIDTHTLTDTQTGAMTIPEGQNWPRVKTDADRIRFLKTKLDMHIYLFAMKSKTWDYLDVSPILRCTQLLNPQHTNKSKLSVLPQLKCRTYDIYMRHFSCGNTESLLLSFTAVATSLSTDQCQTAVIPLLTHWGYCCFSLSHRYYHLSPYTIQWNYLKWGIRNHKCWFVRVCLSLCLRVFALAKHISG